MTGITPRDKEVLELLAQGLDNKAIASSLEISSHTVKQHVRMMAIKSGLLGAGRASRVLLVQKLGDPLQHSSVIPSAAWDSLSPRVREVATFAVAGMKNREIGQRLGLNPHTVQQYLRPVYDALGVWTRLELAVWYAAHFGWPDSQVRREVS